MGSPESESRRSEFLFLKHRPNFSGWRACAQPEDMRNVKDSARIVSKNRTQNYKLNIEFPW